MLLSNYTSERFFQTFFTSFWNGVIENGLLLLVEIKHTERRSSVLRVKKHIADYTDVYINENIPYFPVKLCKFRLKLKGIRCFININLYK